MQPSASTGRSVFISYSRADLGPVRSLAMALRHLGVRTWLDLDDLRPGQRWKDAIGSALVAADAMVFCVSALSLESAWTSVELARAQALALPVLPVAIERLDLHALPDTLRDLHVHDMSLHPPLHAAALTARDIAQALGQPVAPLPRAGLLADVLGGASADWVVFAMADAGPADVAAALGVASPLAWVDLQQPGLLHLPDLLHWAGQARHAALLVGPGTDAALAGLVIGTLCHAFGSRRVTLLAPDDRLAATAQVAGLVLRRL